MRCTLHASPHCLSRALLCLFCTSSALPACHQRSTPVAATCEPPTRHAVDVLYSSPRFALASGSHSPCAVRSMRHRTARDALCFACSAHAVRCLHATSALCQSPPLASRLLVTPLTCCTRHLASLWPPAHIRLALYAPCVTALPEPCSALLVLHEQCAACMPPALYTSRRHLRAAYSSRR